MGPIALFDKSFLQQLTEDESVWFDHFYLACVSPIFYVETCADLAKAVRPTRTPEEEVAIIARKFPEMHGTPCAFHLELAFANLMGESIPMTGQIPVHGGRRTVREGRYGLVFESLDENVAFSRWSNQEFEDVERNFAKHWRMSLDALDLSSHAALLRLLDLNNRRCKSYEEARDISLAAMSQTDNSLKRLELAVKVLGVEPRFHTQLIKRWQISGSPSITSYAPFAAHVVAIEIFFGLCMANGLISSERKSNRNDISYLHYLPFCMFMTSSDRLHRACAPLFMRPDQCFVWGGDLKEDMRKLNTYYSAVSPEQQRNGLLSFAPGPPVDISTLTTDLWNKFFPTWRENLSNSIKRSDGPDRLAEEIDDFASAQTVEEGDLNFDSSELDSITIRRSVKPRKGQWWQLPRDIALRAKNEGNCKE